MVSHLEVNDRSTVLFGRAEELLPQLTAGARTVFVTDTAVAACHRELFRAAEPLTVGRGEESKTLGAAAALYDGLIARGADRTSLVVGIGGGIVTDMAGFAAATYMRGVRFGFVPTTLLAQVDASVGGKNGVNVGGYKNMVGTFAQPEFVVCDVGLLHTLPEREFRAGLAEALKAGIIADAELFRLLETSGFDALRRDDALTEEVVRRALRVKADIVARDECEHGDRRLLNLGHTMAHAIEKCSREMNHGEAVAVGTVMAARAAAGLGMMSREDCGRVCRAVTSLGFRTELPVGMEALFDAVAKDKKSAGDMLHLVLPTSVGSCTTRLVAAADLPEIFGR